MRYLVWTVVIIVALVALMGCSLSVKSRPSEQQAQNPNELFLQMVDARAPSFENATNNQLFELRTTVCSALDSGLSFNRIVFAIMSQGTVSAEDAGAFVGLSVASACPQHRAVLQ